MVFRLIAGNIIRKLIKPRCITAILKSITVELSTTARSSVLNKRV